jgi:hypothetical protein
LAWSTSSFSLSMRFPESFCKPGDENKFRILPRSGAIGITQSSLLLAASSSFVRLSSAVPIVACVQTACFNERFTMPDPTLKCTTRSRPP